MKPYVMPNTWTSEKERLAQVQKVMGEKPVRKITKEVIEQYIAQRLQAGRSGKTINLEIGALRRLMKEAAVWRRIGDSIKPLTEHSRTGRALEKDEKARLLEVATKSEQWAWARLAATLALNTTMRSCEIRGLQWKHVDLLDKALTIWRQTTKTDAGERRLPLNADAFKAILELRELSKKLFGDDLQPEWYVFPSCEGFAHPDPSKPMKGWRTAWRNVTRAVECPKCGRLQRPTDFCRSKECKADMQGIKSPLAGLRFHDLRHSCITMLSESQASDSTLLSIAGHVTRKMLEHYSHIRMAAKRAALDALCDTPKTAQDATPTPVTSQNHVTTQAPKTVTH
jgi:integrase